MNQWFPQGYYGQNHGTNLLPNWEANHRTGRADLQSKEKQKNINTTKAELLQEGIFFLIHLFARDVLVMKKLEIEKTKPTFIISVLKVEY